MPSIHEKDRFERAGLRSSCAKTSLPAIGKRKVREHYKGKFRRCQQQTQPTDVYTRSNEGDLMKQKSPPRIDKTNGAEKRKIKKVAQDDRRERENR